MEEGALELIQLRNQFYRDNYRRVLIALLLMVAVNVLLSGILYYQITHKPAPQYFAISNDGKVVKLFALSEPVIGSSALLQWAANTAVQAFSYNFVNYQQALQDVQAKFTADGWNNFEDALKTSRQLETVIAKKLVVSAVATGAPVILDQGLISGIYAWKVSLPILVTYQSANEITQQPLVVSMIITRTGIVNNPDGIAVVSFVAAERSLR